MTDSRHVALLERIDHTELRTLATYDDIRRLCLEAAHCGFGAVALHPIHCARAAEYLRGSGVDIVAVVGFSTGAFTIEGKAFEARNAIEQGATEIDFVINVGALRGGLRDVVLEEMRALREVARGHTVKAILETSVLTDEEKRLACELAVDAGLDYVETSTGFASGGATVEDVRLMKETVGDAVEVKASGAIPNVQTALAMIEAGASRLGTNAGARIAQALASMSNDLDREEVG
jgi:deoxyribose-phosphate aldolase